MADSLLGNGVHRICFVFNPKRQLEAAQQLPICTIVPQIICCDKRKIAKFSRIFLSHASRIRLQSP